MVRVHCFAEAAEVFAVPMSSSAAEVRLPDSIRNFPAKEVMLLERWWYSMGDLVEVCTSLGPEFQDPDGVLCVVHDAWRMGKVSWHDWVSDTVFVQRNDVCSWEGSSTLVRRVAYPDRIRRRSVNALCRQGQQWVSAPLFPIADLLLRRLDVATHDLEPFENDVMQIFARSSCSAHERNVHCVRAWRRLSYLVQKQSLTLTEDELIYVAEALLEEDLPLSPDLSLLRTAGLTCEVLALVGSFICEPDMLLFRGIIRNLDRMGLSVLAESVKARQKELLCYTHANADGLVGVALRRSQPGRDAFDLLELRDDGTFSYSRFVRPTKCNWVAQGSWHMHSWGNDVRLNGLQAHRMHDFAHVHTSSFSLSHSRSELLQEWTGSAKQDDDGYRAYQDGDRELTDSGHDAVWQWAGVRRCGLDDHEYRHEANSGDESSSEEGFFSDESE